MSDIFISHAEEDRVVAEEIARGLETEGFSTWYYERDSDGGQSYLVQTRQAIVDSRAMVLIVSPTSLGSTQITKEVVRAHESNKPIVPLLRGVTDAEYKRRQPEWEEAIGAATSLAIPPEGAAAIVPRVARGLKKISAATGGENAAGISTPAENKPGNVPAPQRPAVRAAVCGIIGLIGIIWCARGFLKAVSPPPGTSDWQFYSAFPWARAANIAVSGISFLLNLLLVIGAWMSYSLMPIGFKLVRMVTLVIFANIALWVMAMLAATTCTSTWSFVPPADKVSFLVTVLLLTVLGGGQAGVIFYLFRKGR